jgi:hypothetical protein
MRVLREWDSLSARRDCLTFVRKDSLTHLRSICFHLRFVTLSRPRGILNQALTFPFDIIFKWCSITSFGLEKKKKKNSARPSP